MDFNKFDSRTRAESGAPMDILDPITNEPIMDGDKPCRVIVRGVASRAIQAKMRAKQKAAMMSKKAKGKSGEDEEARVMEDLHNDLCEGAGPYIVGFENVSHGEKPATVEDVDWFLDLSFPEMGVKEDDEGNPILKAEKDDDGNPVQVPVFEMRNNPFAKQIGDFASKQANFLGSTKSA